MKSVRLALFADSAPQLLERALLRELAGRGMAAEVRSWAFASPLAVQGELAAFAPDLVLLWACAEAERFPDVRPVLALPYRFLVCNMVARDDGTCGNLAVVEPSTMRARIAAWNAALIDLARAEPRLGVVDLDWIQARLGRAQTFDPRLWEAASVALAPAGTQALAARIADRLCAEQGRLRKVLVTDLDNTLWSGIVSEIGPEAIQPGAPGRRAYRAWLKALAARGVFLAVASRNDREVALAAFRHSEMDMAAEDFAAFEADWGPKSAMLRRIAAQLHVAEDSLVFLDDRPENRAEVRAALPGVFVPELPEDPALWPEALAALNLFEAVQITAEDRGRSEGSRAERQRMAVAAALSPEEYLASLEQVLTPEPLGPANQARAAQLTQRCNQFNMRGTRHTEASLAGRTGWVYRLRDRFGDLGAVSAVVLEGDFIETWVLSCRALNRGVERLVLDHLRSLGPVRGQYVPTERNGRCREVYRENGIPEIPPEEVSR